MSYRKMLEPSIQHIEEMVKALTITNYKNINYKLKNHALCIKYSLKTFLEELTKSNTNDIKKVQENALDFIIAINVDTQSAEYNKKTTFKTHNLHNNCLIYIHNGKKVKAIKSLKKLKNWSHKQLEIAMDGNMIMFSENGITNDKGPTVSTIEGEGEILRRMGIEVMDLIFVNEKMLEIVFKLDLFLQKAGLSYWNN